ncbi:MAG: prepilin-type N-terminal cleavage/methylation domain-containing protein [Chthonomonas sp.]|nr:prepilin-type N-terminal cleavage/methylation domain-containing protein [Chthonomonas sp.]
MKSSYARRRAFTLIELLVVIAIIAILAAILFPVFAQAKLAAKKTQDINNIKQTAIASILYLNDTDDMFHRLQSGGITPANTNMLIGPEDMLQPYMKNEQIWKAPIDSITRNTCGQAGKQPGYAISYAFTFRGNDNNAAETSVTHTFGVHGTSNDSNVFISDSLTQSAIGQTASTINMYPLWMTSSTSNLRSWWRYYSANIRSWPLYPNFLTYTCTGYATGVGSIGAYNGTTNWGFTDGHVASMKQAAVMDNLWVTNPTLAVTNKAKNMVHWSEDYK